MKDSLEVQARKENISVNATRDFDDYHPTDEELDELKEIIRDTKDLTRGELGGQDINQDRIRISISSSKSEFVVII